MKFSRLSFFMLFFAVMLIMLSGCGVIKSTYEGVSEGLFRNEKTGENAEEQSEEETNEITVEIIIESDGDSVNNLEVEINSRKNPQSVYFDSIEVPYREEFTVSSDMMFPLTSTRARASVGDGSEVSCTILYNGEEVATHQSKGDAGRAYCEKLTGPRGL